MATALAALVSLTVVAPVGAITNGSPDAGRHPYVGMVGFYSGTTPSSDPDNWLWRCSGSLISPTVVLTAGHCTAPDAATGDTPVRAQVWFAEHIVPAAVGYPYAGGYLGIPHTYGEYNGANPGHGLVGFSYGDVGVVVLDQPVPTSVVPEDQYAMLPTAGLVDTLATGTSLDQVGYGVSYKLQMSGPPYDRWTGPRDRQYAPSVLISGHEKVADDQLLHSSNPGGGKGGTCFGDSGGPILLGGTSTVLAVNSYGTNANCAGVDYATRVDLPDRLLWINGFVTHGVLSNQTGYGAEFSAYGSTGRLKFIAYEGTTGNRGSLSWNYGNDPTNPVFAFQGGITSATENAGVWALVTDITTVTATGGTTISDACTITFYVKDGTPDTTEGWAWMSTPSTCNYGSAAGPFPITVGYIEQF